MFTPSLRLSDITASIPQTRVTSSLESLALSCLLFCYFPHSLCLPHALPPLCTVWGMVYEHRDLMSHSRSWTKTRTNGEIFTGCVTLTHRSPVSSLDFFSIFLFLFCQMLLCCFPSAPPVPFTRVNGWSGVTVHRYEIKTIRMFADMSSHM